MSSPKQQRATRGIGGSNVSHAPIDVLMLDNLLARALIGQRYDFEPLHLAAVEVTFVADEHDHLSGGLTDGYRSLVAWSCG